MKTTPEQYLPVPHELPFNQAIPLQCSLPISSRLRQLNALISQIESHNAQLSLETEHLKNNVRERNGKAVVFLKTAGLATLFLAAVFLAPELLIWLIGTTPDLPFPLDLLEMLIVGGIASGIIVTTALVAAGSIFASIICIIKNSFDNSKINNNEQHLTSNTSLQSRYREEIATIERLEAPQFYSSIPPVQENFPHIPPISLEKAQPPSFFFAPPRSEAPEDNMPYFNQPDTPKFSP